MAPASVLLLSAAKSVAATIVLFLWAAGLVWKGYANKEFLGTLAKYAKLMFLPSLVFISLSRGLTWHFIQEYWIVSAFGIVVLVVGAFVGRIFASVFRVPGHLHAWYVLAVTLPNMIALPLVLVEALCHEEEDSPGRIAECVEGAQLRLFTLSLTHSYAVWILGPIYVRACRASQPATAATAEKGEDADAEAAHLARVADGDAARSEQIGASDSAHDGIEEIREDPSPMKGNSNSGPEQQATLPAQQKENVCQEILGGLSEPPVIANIAALLVGCLPFLHSLFYGQGAPLSCLTSVLAVVSKASPAVTNAIAGGSFGMQLLKVRRDDPFGIRALGLSGKAMLGLVVGRIIVVPLTLMAVFLAGLDWFPRDRWSRLLLFFQPASPTANVITVLAQLAEDPQGAEMIALSTIPQMILYIPVATLYITMGMKWNEQL